MESVAISANRRHSLNAPQLRITIVLAGAPASARLR
jgi:hypothetical protein